MMGDSERAFFVQEKGCHVLVLLNARTPYWSIQPFFFFG
jgi:hypothetical protein